MINWPLIIVLGVELLSLEGYQWINFLSDAGCKPELQMMYSGSKKALEKDIGATKVRRNHWIFSGNQTLFLAAVASILILVPFYNRRVPISVSEQLLRGVVVKEHNYSVGVQCSSNLLPCLHTTVWLMKHVLVKFWNTFTCLMVSTNS